MTNASAVGAGAGGVGRSASGLESGAPRGRPLVSAVAMLLGTIALLALSASPVAAAPNSLALRATYDVRAQIHWGRGSMSVSSTAHVTNTTDNAVKALTFNLVTLITGAAEVTRVAVDGRNLDPVIVGQSLIVNLRKPLRPGKRVNVTIRYRAAFNAFDGERQNLFMQQDDVITAFRWIPWLSRRQAFAAPNFGETWVGAVSPRVTVTLTSRKPLVYATSGSRTRVTRHSQRFIATDVRDFNFSASPNYRVRVTHWHGVAVRVFTRTLPAKALARFAVNALKSFSENVGPYPYRQLNVAETPAGTGMESPALSWISSSVGPSSLERLVTHEVAHQWFYATVGNNQAMQPFLDEALSDFLTGDLLGSFDRSLCPKAALDGTVYDYSARCYYEVIYVQGSRYIERYRKTVGDDKFWTGLRQFYADDIFKIAGTRALLDYLDAASGYDSQRHADRFPRLYP